MRKLLSLVVLVAVGFGVSLARADDAPKEGPKAADKKKADRPKVAPEERFKKLDKNGDQKVTKEEMTGKIKKAEIKTKMEARFDKLDADKDGALTLEEFTAKPKRKGGKKGGNKGGKKDPAPE